MNSHKKSILELNLSLIIMGGTTIFPKVIDLPVNYIIFGRSLVAAIAIYLFVKISGKKINLKLDRNFPVIIFSGILLGFHWAALFKAIQLSTVSIGILTFFTYPIMTIFLENIFLKTKIYLLDIGLGLLILLGLFFVTQDFHISSVYMTGVLWGLVSALLFSMRMIISKKILYFYDGEETMLYQAIIAALCLIPFLFIQNIPINRINFDAIKNIILLGVFFTALPHTLLVKSLINLKPKTVAILSSLQPLYCIFFAIILLKEIPSVEIAVGGIIIILSVLCETVRSSKQTS